MTNKKCQVLSLFNKQGGWNKQAGGQNFFHLVPEKNYMGVGPKKYAKKCEQGVGQNLRKILSKADFN